MNTMKAFKTNDPLDLKIEQPYKAQYKWRWSINTKTSDFELPTEQGEFIFELDENGQGEFEIG